MLSEINKIHTSPFFQTSFSVDNVILTFADFSLKVLLRERDEEPFISQYSLPGELLANHQESLHVAKKIGEKNIDKKSFYCEQINAFSSLNRHPEGRVITLGHLVLTSHDSIIKSDKIKLFDIESIPKLPFDHNAIISECIKYLVQQSAYYPLVFHLLNKEFSMLELRKLYECLYNTELDVRNFMKKVNQSPFIELTGNYRINLNGKGRKARLYNFNQAKYDKRQKRKINLEFD